MKKKWGGEDHIATDHGPMVQRKLLTSHPGSIHGGEETPGARPSLRQGAGKRSTGAPDLGSAAAAEQRRDREKRLSSRVSRKGEYIGEGGQPGGPPGVQVPPWRRPDQGGGSKEPRPLGPALWPHSGS